MTPERLLDAIAAPVLLLDAVGQVAHASAAARELGIHAGDDVLDGLVPADRRRAVDALAWVAAGGRPQHLVLGCGRDVDGRPRHATVCAGSRETDPWGDQLVVTVDTGAPTDGRDDLTGLVGRRRILDRLVQRLAETRRHGRPTAVVLLDLDGFKQVNDDLGHVAGDAALRSVAEALLGRLRGTDDVGRLGGDEFLLLLPDADRADAESVVADLQAAVGAVEVEGRGRRSRLSISAGICVAEPGTVLLPDAALALADDALAAAKRARRACAARRARVRTPGR